VAGVDKHSHPDIGGGEEKKDTGYNDQIQLKKRHAPVFEPSLYPAYDQYRQENKKSRP
jgi:hypothetical protein